MDRRFLFIAKFFAIFAAAEILILVADLGQVQTFISGTIADFAGLESSGIFVKVSDGLFEITASCTGLVSAGILAAVVFSLRKPEMGNKIALFLAGTAVLLIVNYIRVLVVVIVGKDFGIVAAEITHIASWFLMSAGIILVWYAFTKKSTGIRNFEGFL